MNIIDYVKWRGDLTLKERCFNDVDGFALIMLAYINYDGIDLSEGLTIRQCWQKITEKQIEKNGSYHQQNHYDLMKEMAGSCRFRDLIISDYDHLTLLQQEQQFAAVTVKLDDDLHFVSFRGTDGTLVGWKEDFNMAFQFPVAGQTYSKIYLRNIMEKYTGQFIIGGHSKGGNLAMYAASQMEQTDRINKVFNLDGPGFRSDYLRDEHYLSIMDKTVNYLPESSIVGRLLYNDYQNVAIKTCTDDIFWQHYVYNWLIDVTKPLTCEKLSVESDFINDSIDQWQEQLSLEDKKLTIDIVYSTLVENNITNTEELFNNKLSCLKNLLNRFSKSEGEAKDIMINVCKSLISVSSKTFFDSYFRKDRKNENPDNQ